MAEPDESPRRAVNLRRGPPWIPATWPTGVMGTRQILNLVSRDRNPRGLRCVRLMVRSPAFQAGRYGFESRTHYCGTMIASSFRSSTTVGQFGTSAGCKPVAQGVRCPHQPLTDSWLWPGALLVTAPRECEHMPCKLNRKSAGLKPRRFSVRLRGLARTGSPMVEAADSNPAQCGFESHPVYASLVELADTLVLGTSTARCESSTLSGGTAKVVDNDKKVW